jgi:hypothetical protein
MQQYKTNWEMLYNLTKISLEYYSKYPNCDNNNKNYLLLDTALKMHDRKTPSHNHVKKFELIIKENKNITIISKLLNWINTTIFEENCHLVYNKHLWLRKNK